MKITKLMWFVVAVVIGIFVVNMLLDDRGKREAQRTETRRVEQEIRTVVSQMAADNNAVTEWDSKRPSNTVLS